MPKKRLKQIPAIIISAGLNSPTRHFSNHVFARYQFKKKATHKLSLHYFSFKLFGLRGGIHTTISLMRSSDTGRSFSGRPLLEVNFSNNSDLNIHSHPIQFQSNNFPPSRVSFTERKMENRYGIQHVYCTSNALFVGTHATEGKTWIKSFLVDGQGIAVEPFSQRTMPDSKRHLIPQTQPLRVKISTRGARHRHIKHPQPLHTTVRHPTTVTKASLTDFFYTPLANRRAMQISGNQNHFRPSQTPLQLLIESGRLTDAGKQSAFQKRRFPRSRKDYPELHKMQYQIYKKQSWNQYPQLGHTMNANILAFRTESTRLKAIHAKKAAQINHISSQCYGATRLLHHLAGEGITGTTDAPLGVSLSTNTMLMYREAPLPISQSNPFIAGEQTITYLTGLPGRPITYPTVNLGVNRSTGHGSVSNRSHLKFPMNDLLSRKDTGKIKFMVGGQDCFYRDSVRLGNIHLENVQSIMIFSRTGSSRSMTRSLSNNHRKPTLKPASGKHHLQFSQAFLQAGGKPGRADKDHWQGPAYIEKNTLPLNFGEQAAHGSTAERVRLPATVPMAVKYPHLTFYQTSISERPPAEYPHQPVTVQTAEPQSINTSEKEAEYKMVHDYFKTQPSHTINLVAERVYDLLEKKIFVERDRRGWI